VQHEKVLLVVAGDELSTSSPLAASGRTVTSMRVS
jgi:hypothetical protein